MKETITGTVTQGDQYGRKLGFPTANLNTTTCEAKPGVYAGYAKVSTQTERQPAAIVVSETTKKSKKIEAHLLDFSGDLYGQHISLEIVRQIRDYEHFPNEKALISAITDDIAQTRKLLM